MLLKRWIRKTNCPILDPVVPQWGNRFTQALGLFLMVLMGWKFNGDLPKRAKVVAIGAPHTSNWDFPIAMSAIFAMRLRFHWLGKHTFVNGFGKRVWHALGGIPVDRRKAGGMVEQVVEQFQTRDQFWLGIAPEGTRSKVKGWKLGFFYIAQEAGLPIVMVAFDYRNKLLHFGGPIPVEGGETAVFPQIAAFYADHGVARHPHLGDTSLAAITRRSMREPSEEN